MNRKVYIGLIMCLMLICLVACSKKTEESNANKNVNVNEIQREERKLEDITDKEIIEFVNSAYEMCRKVHTSIDNEKYIERNLKTVFNEEGENIRLVKTKAPYNTLEKRYEALEEYFLDYTIYSKVSDENDIINVNDLILIEDEYYCFPFFEDPSYIAKIREVYSKKISNDRLLVTLLSEYIDYGYRQVALVLENGKLKIDNITQIPKKSFKDISDQEILEQINNANKSYQEIRYSIDMNDKIERNVDFLDGTKRYLEFYKVLEPYNDLRMRSLEVSRNFITIDMMLCKSIGAGIGSYQNNILYYENEIYYFHPGSIKEVYDYEYDEILERVYSEYEDDVVTIKVKNNENKEEIISEYRLRLYGDKIMVEKAEIESDSYTNNSPEQIKNMVNNNVESIFSNVQGNYSVAFKEIGQTDGVYINSTRMAAASTIKIYVMIEAYNQVQKGKISLNDKITITDSMIVGGSGIIQHEPIGTQYTIEELIRLMMVESDNTAANILIEKLGMDNINVTIKSLGCVDTELNRKMMDLESLNKGIDNYTSVDDLCKTLDKLYNGECVNSNYDNNMLDIMKGHQLKSKIPNKLPEGTVVAHKSGEMDGIENDAAIVYTDKGAYVLCILTNNGTSSEQVMAISDVSREIYDKYMEYKGE